MGETILRWMGVRRCAALFSTVLLPLLALPAAAFAAGAPITFGLVARDVVEEERRWTPVLAEANRDLAPLGHELGARVLTSYAGMLWDLIDGRVDLLLAEPLIASKFAAETGARPVLALTGPDGGLARSVIVVRQDEVAPRPVPLAGMSVAFDSPSSTRGHLLPRLFLIETGHVLLEAAVGPAPPPSSKGAMAPVRFVFTMDSLSPVFWLLRHRVDAAAMSEEAFERVDAKRPGTFEVLGRTLSAPQAVLLARADLPPEITSAVITALRRVPPEHFERPARFSPLTPNLDGILTRLDIARVLIEAEDRGGAEP